MCLTEPCKWMEYVCQKKKITENIIQGAEKIKINVIMIFFQGSGICLFELGTDRQRFGWTSEAGYCLKYMYRVLMNEYKWIWKD